MKRLAVLLSLALVAVGAAEGGIAGPDTAATAVTEAPELPESYLFETGKLPRLRAGVAYQASKVPLALRVTPPDGSWRGAQWKSMKLGPEEANRRHLRCSVVCRGPSFGWAAIGKGSGTGTPRALILVMTAYARTPSVATIVESLRTRGHGTTYEASVPVKIGGFSGVQFDGQVVGTKHVFVPFSPPTHKATGFPDAIEVAGPERAFRAIVLNVRGKTVLVFIGSYVLPPDQFADFLTGADQVLKSLRFPAGG